MVARVDNAGLKALGHTKIYNVRDGIAGWLRAGNPVVRLSN
jgi:rhodanese-related sulfurtransferase